MVFAALVETCGATEFFNHIFEKDVFKNKGTKIKQIAFSLPGITDDCIIEYYIKCKLPSRFAFWEIQKEIYLVHGELHWYFSSGKFMVYGRRFASPSSFLLPSGSVDLKEELLPSLKNPKEMLITVNNIEPLKIEPYSLPERASRIKYFYFYTVPGAAEGFWGIVGQDISYSLNSFCKKNKKAKKILRTFSNLKSNNDKTSAAYHWLQENIQNINYDNSDDDKKYKTNHCIDDVIKNRYSTQTDINWVFYDMLREMNIDAKISFVVDRDENILISKAKYWQFDRSLVALSNESPNKYTFYSPADKFLPIGIISWYNEGIKAFIVGDSNQQFITIPFSRSHLNTIKRSIDIQPGEDSTYLGNGYEQHEGHSAREIRILSINTGEKGFHEKLKKKLSAIFKNIDIDSITVDGLKNVNNPVELNYNLTFQNSDQKTSAKWMITPVKYLRYFENPFHDVERLSPVLFDYAYQLEETLNIAFPEGWEIEAVPDNFSFENEVGRCEVQFSSDKDKMTVQRSFYLNLPYIRVEQYKLVQKLFVSEKETERLTFVLRKS